MAFKLATKRTNNSSSATQVDEDEFTGLWINVGIETQDEDGNKRFNRLPRGIAVSDLVAHRIFAKSIEKNPEWTQEAMLVNALIEKIQTTGLKLDEGESIPLNLSVQLYRRQEQVTSVEVPEVNIDLDELFG